VDVAGKKVPGTVRLVEPESLLGLSLGEVLLGLMETGEGQPEPAPAGPAVVEEGPVLRLRMPDGRVEREPLLGGFWRRDKGGGLTTPRIVTRREGKALACKLYRVEGGRALYAGVLKAAGARAFAEGGVPVPQRPAAQDDGGGARGGGRPATGLRLRPARHGR
jgi:hypothetical protein